MKWPGVHRVAISEPDNPVNSATAGQMNGFPFSFSQRAAASSPRTLKISSVTGSGTAKVSASEETRSINPALASKMTGEALMTQDSDTFQFFSQFFGGILEWRDVVPQQQVEKFRARDA